MLQWKWEAYNIAFFRTYVFTNIHQFVCSHLLQTFTDGLSTFEGVKGLYLWQSKGPLMNLCDENCDIFSTRKNTRVWLSRDHLSAFKIKIMI